MPPTSLPYCAVQLRHLAANQPQLFQGPTVLETLLPAVLGAEVDRSKEVG